MTRMHKAPDSATESEGPKANTSPEQTNTSALHRNHAVQPPANATVVLSAIDGQPTVITGLRATYQIPFDAGVAAAQRWLEEMAEVGNEFSAETVTEAIERYLPGSLPGSCIPAFKAGFELRLRQRALAMHSPQQQAFILGDSVDRRNLELLTLVADLVESGRIVARDKQGQRVLHKVELQAHTARQHDNRPRIYAVGGWA